MACLERGNALRAPGHRHHVPLLSSEPFAATEAKWRSLKNVVLCPLWECHRTDGRTDRRTEDGDTQLFQG